MSSRLLPAMGIVLGLCGCSAHSPLILTNTTDTQAVSAKKYPAHTRKVYVSESGLPATVHFEVLENIEVGKVWYGSDGNVKESMADRARQIGADAVIEVKTWHQPSGFSWAAPHGSGKAVKIVEADLPNLQLAAEMF
jgi:hypothetical protein